MTATNIPDPSGAIDGRNRAGRVPSTHSPRQHRSPGQQRAWSRAVHVLAGLVLGTYVYAPAAVAQPLHLALQVVLVPAVVLSGLFMWKQAQIRRLMNRRTVVR